MFPEKKEMDLWKQMFHMIVYMYLQDFFAPRERSLTIVGGEEGR